MKIIDGFLFYNEYNMLEGRLKYLYPYVDYFVIVEGNITFSGKQKPFNFLQNIQRYKPYLDKIIYRPFITKNVDHLDFTVKPDYMDLSTAPWQVEFMQRDEILKVAEIFDDNDLLIISDTDEIPSHKALEIARQGIEYGYQYICFKQQLFLYNFKKRAESTIVGPVAIRNRVAREKGTSWIRLARDYEMAYIDEGGWHLTYWFSPEDIKLKIESFSHQEFNNDYIKNLDRIKHKIKNNLDLYDRTISMIDVDYNSIDRNMYEVFKDYQLLL